MSKELSIIIPFYNESRRLKKSIITLFEFLKHNRNLEIIYVDDGSNDESMKLLKEEISKYTSMFVLDNITFQFHYLKNNIGKGGAIRKGILESNGKFVLYCDFDFAISLKEIKNFLLEIKSLPNQKGAIIASRRQDSIVIKKQSPLRKFLGHGFHKIMKIIVNIPLKDTQCGFKMFDSETAKNIFKTTNTKGFAFDVEVLYKIIRKKLPVIEKGVRITHEDEYSTINIFTDPFKMIWDLIKLRWRLLCEFYSKE